MLWVWLALLSALLIAVASVINKKLLLHDHAMELGAAQSAISLILIILITPILIATSIINFNIGWQYYLILWLISLLLTTGNLFYLKSIRHSELSSALPLMNISPLFLLIIAFLFLGEKPTTTDIIGVMMLIIGAYVLHASTSKKGILEPLKALIKEKSSIHMLFALIIYSVTATMEKGVINQGINFITILILIRGLASINYIILEWYNHGLKELITDLKRDWKQLITAVITSLTSGLAYTAALAQPGAMVSLVIPLRRSSTLMGTLLAGKLFHEHNLLIKIIASIVMLAGITIIAF